MPCKVTYTEEGTTRRGPAGYKITYEFQKGAPENIREKIPVFFLRHVMQQAINLEEEKGPDIGYSDHKIRPFPYRLEITLCKYNGLHPMVLGMRNYGKMGGGGGREGYVWIKTKQSKKKKKKKKKGKLN